jgi:hypothetical protein
MKNERSFSPVSDGRRPLQAKVKVRRTLARLKMKCPWPLLRPKTSEHGLRLPFREKLGIM